MFNEEMCDTVCQNSVIQPLALCTSAQCYSLSPCAPKLNATASYTVLKISMLSASDTVPQNSVIWPQCYSLLYCNSELSATELTLYANAQCYSL